MPDHEITAEALARDWTFWKCRAGEPRVEVAASEVVTLRGRDIYALCEHGQISTNSFSWFSEPKR